MPLVIAKYTNCGTMLDAGSAKNTATVPSHGIPFVAEKLSAGVKILFLDFGS